MPEGAVVVRSADPELQLQGLRSALSLALGDRPSRLYLAGPGTQVLSAAVDSEAGRCLSALREAGIPVLVDDGGHDPTGSYPRMPLAELLEAIAAASFQQTF